jgi:hypothetical protein
MFNLDLNTTSKTQLIHFYKAIKMASALMPGHNQTARKTGLLADQIVAELKTENPDKEKIEFLTTKIQELANVNIPIKF